MGISRELELVPPQNRERIKTHFMNRIGDDLQCSRLPKMESLVHQETRLVNVTFLTSSGKNIVELRLTPYDCYDRILEQVKILYPKAKSWRLWAEISDQETPSELINDLEVWHNIQQAPLCKFYYILIRLELIERKCVIS